MRSVALLCAVLMAGLSHAAVVSGAVVVTGGQQTVSGGSSNVQSGSQSSLLKTGYAGQLQNSTNNATHAAAHRRRPHITKPIHNNYANATVEPVLSIAYAQQCARQGVLVAPYADQVVHKLAQDIDATIKLSAANKGLRGKAYRFAKTCSVNGLTGSANVTVQPQTNVASIQMTINQVTCSVSYTLPKPITPKPTGSVVPPGYGGQVSAS